jgi:UDP-glucose 4-epimerase
MICMSETSRILVTGGAGFIGSHVVDRLINSGYSVRVIDDLSTGNLANIAEHFGSGRIDFVEGDVRDAEVVKKCVHDIDAAIHLGAVTSVPLSVQNPGLTFETNVSGTLNLLVACAEEKVGKFVFVSSCAVYGEPKYLPVDEGHGTSPISPYAESKFVAERFSFGFHEKRLLKSVILRLFNVYGPRQGVNDYSGVVARFIDRSRQGLPLIIYGDGSQKRDFVNVRDVAEAVLLSVEKSEAEGVFNIGSGEPTSVRELAEIVSELTGMSLEILHDKPRPGDIRDSYANISKAEKLLGYSPKVPLEEGLRAILPTENVQCTSEVFDRGKQVEA